MSFFSSSPNFITQRLIVDFKGLNDKESIEKYELLKSKTREKIRDYYPKVYDKFEFYKEIIELLGTRDGEYILLNLFFESEADIIVFNLKKNKVFNLLECRNPETFSYKLLSEVNRQPNFQIISFLKENFTSLIDISDADWKNENQNIHPLIRAFATWLPQNANRNSHDYDLGILLFEKIWDTFFSKPFNNQKALIFVSVLIDEIRKSASINTHQHLDRIKTNISELFVQRSYSILMDGVNFINETSQGYVTKRLKLEELLDTFRSKEKNFLEWTYQKIFEGFDFMNPTDKEKAINDIYLKIESGDIPTESELSWLLSKNESSKLLEVINRKCYLFESLPFKET